MLTQQIAIRASFRRIPYGPDAVDLVECHPRAPDEETWRRPVP